jgi:hypothetical protein
VKGENLSLKFCNSTLLVGWQVIGAGIFLNSVNPENSVNSGSDNGGGGGGGGVKKIINKNIKI